MFHFQPLLLSVLYDQTNLSTRPISIDKCKMGMALSTPTTTKCVNRGKLHRNKLHCSNMRIFKMSLSRLI